MSEAAESEPVPPPAKSYLGDSVYADFDGYHIILTTENGYPDDPRNKIALEPEVMASLKAYEKRLNEFKADFHRRNG
jgi:hypothetical protein